MAVTVIQNSCVAGAMAGISRGRFLGSFTATDYAALAVTARKIADEFITENTASGAAIADGDNANVGPLVQGVADAVCSIGFSQSATAADFLAIAKQIYAQSKQAVAQLI